MNQNDEKKIAFIEQLEQEIDHHLRLYRIDSRVQLGVMLLIAIAGFLTGAAGLDEAQTAWYAQSSALLLWGGIATVGAAFNQIRDPGKSSNKHHNTKIALKGIKEGIQLNDLPLDEAAKFHLRAWRNPEGVIDELLRWQPPVVHLDEPS